MMNYIFTAIIIFSFIAAAFSGNMGELSGAIIGAGAAAVNLLLKLLGMLCLWGGLMNIAEKSGLTEYIRRLLSPLLRLLFPKIDKSSPAMRAISMNVTANLLGLGNAATPLGIEAMRRLKEENKSPLMPSNEMALFVVINTAAIKLIPTTAATLRQSFGSQSPMDIMPASWAASALALAAGITASKVLEKINGKNE